MQEPKEASTEVGVSFDPTCTYAVPDVIREDRRGECRMAVLFFGNQVFAVRPLNYPASQNQVRPNLEVRKLTSQSHPAALLPPVDVTDQLATFDAHRSRNAASGMIRCLQGGPRLTERWARTYWIRDSPRASWPPRISCRTPDYPHPA